MDRVDLIGHHQLRQAGMFALLYAAACLVEGVGLLCHKTWAEYFTVTLTALGLPWEIFELVKRFEAYKIGLMVSQRGDSAVFAVGAEEEARSDGSGGVSRHFRF